MKKSRLLLGAAAIITVAAVSVGGTIAWLTSSPSPVKNKFTVGSVEVSVHETDWDDATTGGSHQNLDIYPSQIIPKNPIVTNDGKNPCYVRVKVAIPKGTVGGTTNQDIFTLNDLNQDGGWTKDGDFYYYDSPLAPNTPTTELFKSVTLKADYEEGSAASASVSIDVYAEAIQSQGFDTPAQAWAAFDQSLVLKAS